MDEKGPGLDDVKWILDAALAALAAGDPKAALRRLTEARYSIDMMRDEVILELCSAPPP